MGESTLAEQFLQMTHSSIQVRDLFDNTGRNINSLFHLVPQTIAEKIGSIPITAQRTGLLVLWIESDSTLSIHCITRGGGPWAIQDIICHIRHLLVFDRDTVTHIYREENQVADLLASEGWDRRCYSEYSSQDLPRRLIQIIPHTIAEEIGSIPITPHVDDQIFWTDTSDSRFATKSACQLGLITVDIEIQRQIGSHMASRCQCCSAIETIQYLFIDSPTADLVWRHFTDIFHITLRPFKGFQYRFQTWRFSGQFVSTGHIRTIILLLILWFLRIVRNDAKYRDISMASKRIIWRVYHTISLMHTGRLFRHIHWRGDMDIAPLFGILLTTPLHFNLMVYSTSGILQDQH
ncbi:Uncharacterized protein Adt_04597 [Abeliophyllum distichum]|uniref:RNase H type-1 domain-containing protein n=1 Tax=Abeliophyllum distichum TaxID=126358 RepID=A0ABD1V227_9LAMI